jgi:maltooligosyltrehalose trehalohydrolase
MSADVHTRADRSTDLSAEPAASFGALVNAEGTLFRIWAPAAHTLTLLVDAGDGASLHQPRQTDEGIWELFVPGIRAGARYAYTLENGEPRPDPASRFQPDGVHRWSEVIDPSAFGWTDDAWNGIAASQLVFYELHVGTFAGKGTFGDVRSRLHYLRDLGITAIELMPVADFPGRWNWGYDGVALFAPSRAYGRPDDLRALVDAAHDAGLAIVLDVVYNHLGPEGAYLPAFSPQFLTPSHNTPWGCAVNLDDDYSGIVRQFLVDNARHWLLEYHVDGLRLDATHALIDSGERPFVAELAAAVHRARHPRPFVVAEDARNLARLVEDVEEGGWGLDGVWADDFHHVVRRMLTGDAHGYYADYRGDVDELVATLQRGWLFVGQHSVHHGAPRGTDPSNVPMRKAIICIQNHDQIGNRAVGDRLHHAIEPAEWRAVVALLLAAPMTPLLFMGQEWSTSSPFQFFTDFAPELGARVTEGRREEFAAFPEFAPETGRRIPNPQAVSTFEASRLCWSELREPDHAAVLALHRALLALRAVHPALQASDATSCDARALDDTTVLIVRQAMPDAHAPAAAAHPPAVAVIVRLRGAGEVPIDASRWVGLRTLLTTEDPAFASDAVPPVLNADKGTVRFGRPGALLIEFRVAGSQATE